jgi:uncharacterized protein YndB with AHSA1/START domain
MRTSDAPIVVEQTFISPIELVWNALVDVEEMHKWYFDNIPAFQPVVGFETQFNIQSEERTFLHIWKVTKAEPCKLIEYTWQFKGYKGKSSSKFELSEHGEVTKIKLIIDTLEDFPEDIPEFKRESCIAGWDYLIHNRLMEYLENT